MLHNYIDKIKSRLLPSSIISQYIQLKNKRSGEFLGLCPFHQEKTPSFTVSDIKRFYHCFGCGAHGDIISFIMDISGLSYRDALAKLASIAGVSLPKSQESYQYSTKQRNALLSCISVFEEIAKFYQRALFSELGRDALSYFYSRGLRRDIIEKYRLGYAPDNSEILFKFLKKNFTQVEISESLFFGNNAIFQKDPFRGRVIFPIFNLKKQVVAFGGRVLNNSIKPKYLNSFENPLFHKGDILYAMHIAEPVAYKLKEIIVVEGYMDVLALASSNIENVVAPLGTSFRLSHVEQLWRVVNNPTICFDSDNAGVGATKRIAVEVLPHIAANKSLKFVALSEGKDIDEVINKMEKNRGADARKIFNNAIPLADFLFTSEVKASKLPIPEEYAALKSRLIDLASKIRDFSLGLEYKKYFLDLFFKIRDKKYQKKIESILYEEKSKQKMKLLMNQKNHHIITILCILLKFKELLEQQDIYEEFMLLEAPDIGYFSKLREYILLNWSGAFDCDSEIAKKEYQPLIDEVSSAKVYIGSSIAESKEVLMRAFKINTIKILQSQIFDAQKDVVEDPTEVAMERLLQLKSYELQYKNELKIH